MTVLLIVSVGLQIGAAVLAFRLVRITDRTFAWLAVALALSLMAVRRAIAFGRLVSGQAQPDLAAELVALTISVLLVAGMASIAPFFRKIRRTERKVDQLIESAPDAMVIADHEDRIVQVNAKALRLFGYLSRDMIGAPITMLMPERFRERHSVARERFRKAPRPRTLGMEEGLLALRKDGTEFPVEISLNPIEGPEGHLVASAIRDVTERRRAQQELRDSEGRYRSLLDDVLDSSAVGVCILDADFRVVWINRAYESFFGVRRSEIVGFDARRIVRERLHHLFEDHRGFLDRVLATYEGNSYVEQFECHVVGDGREERWLEHWSRPIESGLYKGGRIEHYADVTERRLAEDRIRLFVHIARNMQMGLVVYRLDDLEDDRSLRIVMLNPEAERLFGVPREELLDKRIDEAFPVLRERGIPQLFAEVIRDGETREMEDFSYGDNRVLENVWSFKAFPLPDQRVGVAFEAITERKRIEQLIRDTAAGVAVETGDRFFRSLVEHLSRSLGADYAFVGELHDGTRVRTIAVWALGEKGENFSYDLAGTPCAHVIGDRLCCHEEGVQRLFPEDALLHDLRIESYAAAPLFDSSGEAVGIVGILGRERLRDPETAKAVLQIFAARAGAELERQRAARASPST